jgi:predicted  nucleic acid-binding Zn-ribbon protein
VTHVCIVCGEIIDSGLAAISHTIQVGKPLCSKCGQRESLDPAWAEGMRRGMVRGEVAAAVVKAREGCA